MSFRWLRIVILANVPILGFSAIWFFSLLPVFPKILEKIICKQLSNYSFEQKIIPVTQSGFRTRHSTSTALLKVSDDIFRATDEGMHTCLLLLDYSKAFDTLDHDMLCLKLKHYGLHASAVNFLNDYLHDRRQRVVLDNVPSDVLNLNRGVLQGSILGPLLFFL